MTMPNTKSTAMPVTTLLTGGLGLKPEHYGEALESREPGLWLEVHAENYMSAGGPRLGWLEAIRAAHPLSLHGVGLSLGADAPPDAAHLTRLVALVDRFEPALVSEHLAWSAWGGTFLPDLLPVPRTQAALLRVVDNISQAQERLGRPIAIENPSHYLSLPWHEYSEADFLDELVRRAGCRILLDVNNVYVSARNLGLAPEEMLADLLASVPGSAIAEIHLAGHSEDPTHGPRLLVDSHDAPVAEAVWTLYRQAIDSIGARPTLIERDGNLPDFGTLLQERGRAHDTLHPCLVVEPA